MSSDLHPVNTLLSPLVDREKQTQYLQFVTLLQGLSIAELIDRLRDAGFLTWQWHEVLSRIRCCLAVASWDEVVKFRDNPLVQSMAEARLRKIASEARIGWLFQFLGVRTTPWVTDLLYEELRTRVAALKITEPIPGWFTEKLHSAREQGDGYLGLLEQKALELMHAEAVANLED